MRRFVATLLLFIAISLSAADDCRQNVGTSCQGKEGTILCCEDTGFVYCQWTQLMYAFTPCLSEFPYCYSNDHGFLDCENDAAWGFKVTRVSNTGDVGTPGTKRARWGSEPAKIKCAMRNLDFYLCRCYNNTIQDILVTSGVRIIISRGFDGLWEGSGWMREFSPFWLP